VTFHYSLKNHNRLQRQIAIFLLLLFCISCQQSDKQINVSKDNLNSGKGLTYYKCDYTKTYDTILSSGSDTNKLNEIWGVDTNDINNISTTSLDSVNLNFIIDNAKQHLRKRFSDMSLTLSSLTLERIDDHDTTNPRNWFFTISFLYDKKGYYQDVPVLLDGRIILSNQE
jgi:hypothetical protein